MTDTAAPSIPGYLAGTWSIDPVHSHVEFSVRHMMVSKVRGKFTNFSGELVTGATPLDSSVSATIELASIDTGNGDRDNHIRSADFFNVEAHQQMSYRSTGVRAKGDDFVLDGVCAAINQGIDQADKQMEAELEKVTGGVKIPGMV